MSQLYRTKGNKTTLGVCVYLGAVKLISRQRKVVPRGICHGITVIHNDFFYSSYFFISQEVIIRLRNEDIGYTILDRGLELVFYHLTRDGITAPFITSRNETQAPTGGVKGWKI